MSAEYASAVIKAFLFINAIFAYIACSVSKSGTLSSSSPNVYWPWHFPPSPYDQLFPAGLPTHIVPFFLFLKFRFCWPVCIFMEMSYPLRSFWGDAMVPANYTITTTMCAFTNLLTYCCNSGAILTSIMRWIVQFAWRTTINWTFNKVGRFIHILHRNHEANVRLIKIYGLKRTD